jgi:hypothetical protein
MNFLVEISEPVLNVGKVYKIGGELSRDGCRMAVLAYSPALGEETGRHRESRNPIQISASAISTK